MAYVEPSYSDLARSFLEEKTVMLSSAYRCARSRSPPLKEYTIKRVSLLRSCHCCDRIALWT
jgi:hypothetical protein